MISGGLLLRWLDVFLSGPGAAKPVGSLLLRGTRLLVRPGVLLVTGMTHRVFCVGLLQWIPPAAGPRDQRLVEVPPPLSLVLRAWSGVSLLAS